MMAFWYTCLKGKIAITCSVACLTILGIKKQTNKQQQQQKKNTAQQTTEAKQRDAARYM